MDFFMDLNAGVIAVTSAFGADFRARQNKIPAADITPLKTLADIMWLSWKSRFSDPEAHPACVKYIMSTSVINDRLLSTIKRCFDQHSPPITKLPRYAKRATFDVNRDAECSLVLLGSPLISSMARLLIDHKEALGDLFIESISVWDEFAEGSTRSNLKSMAVGVNVLVVVKESHGIAADSPAGGMEPVRDS